MAVFTGNGSAASPSFTFSSDTDLGIYRSGEDDLSITTGSTQRAVVDSSGRMIIGTASGLLEHKFQIQGNTNSTESSGSILLRRGQTNPAFPNTLGELKFSDEVGTLGASIVASIDSSWSAGSSPGKIVFYTTPSGSTTLSDRMSITAAGNVEIGGSLGTSPNINLNEDGSVFHTSTYQLQPNSQIPTATDLIYVDPSVENTDNEFNFLRFAVSGSNDRCIIRKDGSAEFAKDIAVNGLTVGRGGGDVDTNTAIGFDSLTSNTTGLQNTVTGRGALYYNTIGDKNTANGFSSLFTNIDGTYNTASGAEALYFNTSGTNNTASGSGALYSNTTGDYNSALGREAGLYAVDGSDAETFNNCTYLGYDTRADGDNQVQLGDSNTTTYAFGAVQDRSDERDKTDIRDTLLGLDFIKSLRPVDFRWDYRDDYFDSETYEVEETRTRQVLNSAYTVDGEEPEFIEEAYTETVTRERLVPAPKDGSRSRRRFHHGLIAQEVKAAADAQGIDFAGYQDHSVNGGCDVLSIGYTEMIAPLIKAVQELSAENSELKKRLDDAGL